MIDVDHVDMISRRVGNITRNRPDRLPPSIALARTALFSPSNLVYVIEWRDDCGNQRANLGWPVEDNDSAYVLTSALLPGFDTLRVDSLYPHVAIDKDRVTSVTEIILSLPTLANRPFQEVK